jgi:hypothetical protein
MHFNRNQQAIEAFKNAIQIGHSEGNYESIYQEALYWCAVCLESEKTYLDAIYLYRAVQDISILLNPESRYREIKCLILSFIEENYNLFTPLLELMCLVIFIYDVTFTQSSTLN